MLIKGNQKLGKEIYHFSIPAGETCPCQTTDCASVCYAKDGFYNFTSTQDSLSTSLARAYRDDFVEKMIAAIERRKVKVLRIHVSGDFFSAWYVRKWVEIARRCPNVKFYTYTRSWRRADLLEALVELAALGNVALWWSADRETDAIDGAPPVVDRVRVAYMCMDDHDPVPGYVDLVFRVKYKTVHRRVNDKQVCPVENGIKYAENRKPTCSRCKICYRSAVGNNHPVQRCAMVGAN